MSGKQGRGGTCSVCLCLLLYLSFDCVCFTPRLVSFCSATGPGGFTYTIFLDDIFLEVPQSPPSPASPDLTLQVGEGGWRCQCLFLFSNVLSFPLFLFSVAQILPIPIQPSPSSPSGPTFVLPEGCTPPPPPEVPLPIPLPVPLPIPMPMPGWEEGRKARAAGRSID